MDFHLLCSMSYSENGAEGLLEVRTIPLNLKSGPAHAVNSSMIPVWLLPATQGKLVTFWCGRNEILGLCFQSCPQWDTFTWCAPQKLESCQGNWLGVTPGKFKSCSVLLFYKPLYSVCFKWCAVWFSGVCWKDESQCLLCCVTAVFSQRWDITSHWGFPKGSSSFRLWGIRSAQNSQK